MNILVIADPIIPVPPKHYGGAERIVHLYCREFARRGHTIHLLAGAGSSSYGGRLGLHKAPTMNYLSRARRKLQFQLQSLWAAQGCDIVFNYGRFDYLVALLRSQIPILHCFQNPIDQEQIDAAERIANPALQFLMISQSQLSQAKVRQPVHILANPVDCSFFKQGKGEGGYLVFLGRLTYNKGVDTAIAVAKRTGQRLLIAGNISDEPGGRDFFEQRIQPLLDGSQITWVGAVDDQQKQALLSDASALLFPIRWDEPFGIVMAEALACGTPVIAMRRGSTPEVIRHGKTGFLCDDEDDLVEGVNALAMIDRNHCRMDAESRFDVQILATKVLDILDSMNTAQ